MYYECVILYYTQKIQKMYITFIQRRPNVFYVGPTLYKWYTNVCVAGFSLVKGTTFRVGPIAAAVDEGQFSALTLQIDHAVHGLSQTAVSPTNTQRRSNAGSMLGQHLTGWPNIKPVLITYLVFAGRYKSWLEADPENKRLVCCLGQRRSWWANI